MPALKGCTQTLEQKLPTFDVCLAGLPVALWDAEGSPWHHPLPLGKWGWEQEHGAPGGLLQAPVCLCHAVTSC